MSFEYMEENEWKQRKKLKNGNGMNGKQKMPTKFNDVTHTHT